MYTKIIDDRIDFKVISFSNYKIKEIKKDIIKFINNCDIEKCCFFSADLICSGLFLELWDIIINVLGKNISICNVKLICYLDLKFIYFKEFINSGIDEIELRNSQNIRELFCEIISVLCLSNKIQTVSRVKIQKDEIDYSTIANKLKADNIEYSKLVYKDNDPKELFIAINELVFNIHNDNPNQLLIYFWIEWILKYFSKIKKHKNIVCEKRNYPVSEKDKNNIIFIIWDCIKTKESDNALINKCIDSLINLFCIRYSSSCNNKRVFLIYLAVKLLISKNINLDVPIVENKDLLHSIIKKNDYIYKKIKKNEINQYTGGEPIDEGRKLQIDKSIEKLNILYGKNSKLKL